MKKATDNDFIRTIDEALEPEFCAEIIDRFEASDQTEPGRTGGGVDRDKKHSLDLTITGHADWKSVCDRVLANSFEHVTDYWCKYYFGLIGALGLTVADPETGQPVNLSHKNFDRAGKPQARALVGHLYRPGPFIVQKYDQGVGGYPHWHSEIYPRDASCEHLHRVLLFMYYLNDVAEGGETEFFYQQRSIRPRRGRMVIAPAGFTHTHRGLTPRSGDKYILTSWILFNRAEKLYGGSQ
ncbi:MAG: 2OG-Fe(II) oxygenase [Xanthomonadales bacterium]|nr:2OG-Fe(II) oxygenase [Xanthomonadales bacterium]